MTTIIPDLALLAAITLITLGAWRWSDRRAERAVWKSLASQQPPDPGVFDSAMVNDLPGPARRYFLFAIRPGTRLYTVAEISMEGQLSLGSSAEPDYRPMHAQQILALPHGFSWQVQAGGRVPVSGSDGAKNGKSWSRFWALGLLPVARAGGNGNHSLAAFGRYVAEAIFWTPAALLPSPYVQWYAIDESTARVSVIRLGQKQSVDITVDAEGRLTQVVLQRWSDANPAKEFQYQPFGGYLSDYREFDGFRLPTRVEAGNFFGTEDYFPFFKATVTSIRFPLAPGN